MGDGLTQRIGILGGTFNPIHYGHLAAAEEVRERLKLDRILFIPSFRPPHKHEDDVPSAAHRMEMVRIAVRENATFETSDIEIKRRGKSFTVDTIESLKKSYPDAELYFITGVDSFLDIQTWNRWERLLSLCTFVVLSRPGYRFADLLKIGFLMQAEPQMTELDRGQRMHAEIHAGTFTVYMEMIPLYDISSTDIRGRVKAGRSIKYLLPELVETYIIKYKLYA
jgi:nicotinate-nucleotide adenylyltransferase